ncbi:hypothetical protein RRG08_052811 [Elysia crispata]|uniref:Uncharacterized protein n=1 Tax=Elysia crispata TaxID=231223 RepID=A0AAE1EC08_9GAST|nr:hypothetical protein RRG08_052811 [Elysia crispata]
MKNEVQPPVTANLVSECHDNKTVYALSSAVWECMLNYVLAVFLKTWDMPACFLVHLLTFCLKASYNRPVVLSRVLSKTLHSSVRIPRPTQERRCLHIGTSSCTAVLREVILLIASCAERSGTSLKSMTSVSIQSGEIQNNDIF